jgi:GTPase SAR1 family protein
MTLFLLSTFAVCLFSLSTSLSLIETQKMSEKDHPEHKVIVIGARHTGKTSLISMIMYSYFVEEYNPRIVDR